MVDRNKEIAAVSWRILSHFLRFTDLFCLKSEKSDNQEAEEKK